MVRVKRGNVARKRRKKILQLAKGYRGAHSRLFRVANQQVMKALRYSYVGRKQKKRIFTTGFICLPGSRAAVGVFGGLRPLGGASESP